MKHGKTRPAPHGIRLSGYGNGTGGGGSGKKSYGGMNAVREQTGNSHLVYCGRKENRTLLTVFTFLNCNFL
ncbi:MAG: hypothetical protein LBD48_11100 [Treponema sp.]|jgi:hypothetical protein|nr:hypothetical protein [Treponema sp.]